MHTGTLELRKTGGPFYLPPKKKKRVALDLLSPFTPNLLSTSNINEHLCNETPKLGLKSETVKPISLVQQSEAEFSTREEHKKHDAIDNLDRKESTSLFCHLCGSRLQMPCRYTLMTTGAVEKHFYFSQTTTETEKLFGEPCNPY